ncbi:MAG: inorganic phosphate transporter [Pseudothermotoga sp.]
MKLNLLPAIFLGWSLGANDAANCFGPFVGSGLISYKRAIAVAGIFVVIGAVVGGQHGLTNISAVSKFSSSDASLALFSAALTVTGMTWLKLPVSTSQAVIGAIIGLNVKTQGFHGIDWSAFLKFFIVWVLTPVGAFLISLFMYKIGAFLFRKIRNIQLQDVFIKTASWMVGIYGAYALGANNVANVTGVFVGSALTVTEGAILGGLSIAFGILTFSKRVILTVGKNLIELDHFSSLVAVFSHSVTVWLYSLIGIPVSSSQAIVGGVLGAGLARGERLSYPKMLYRVLMAWIETPVVSGLVSFSLSTAFIEI